MDNTNNKIKISTGRNGESMELPMTVTYLYLPDGAEFSIRYDAKRKAIEITKAFSADGEDDESINIKPNVSNSVYIR